ncbi:MAG: host attachment protein [Woeseiaceae bacterium]
MVETSLSSGKKYWIVVADESRAEIYTRDARRAPLAKILSLENATSRMKTGEIISDRGGRSYDSIGTGRHTMAAEKANPKKHASTIFANQIAERIGKVTHDGSCRGYALIAAPRFLGMLRDSTSRKCRFEPFKTIDKDVVGQDPTFLQNLVDND